MKKRFKNLYVAATSQHVGKTTSTLGLVSAFLQQNYSVGYCKPVGQKALKINNLYVDKDAQLFSDMIRFELQPELHSPVILGKGATTDFLNCPENFPYKERILRANELLNAENEITIFEGTGHPGVGSVVNLSNADVAKLIDAGVIMVVEGGVGNTIDLLTLNFALFQAQNVPILGVIVNKVLPEKREKVAHFVGKWLAQKNIPLLGILPYDRSLGFPLLRTIVEAVQGEYIYHREKMFNSVACILGSSVIDTREIPEKSGVLLIVSMRRVDVALAIIQEICEKEELIECPLVGIIATADGELNADSVNYIKKHQIPFVRSRLDTYGIVIKYDNLEVKINPNTPWKITRAVELINQYVDLPAILKSLS